ncbi:hypothetical protein JMUB5695_02273 [Mycobacterium heckeshornense]|nr:hypothetical protein JMUB5695_02273 [Mycobacterium heckeshornense]
MSTTRATPGVIRRSCRPSMSLRLGDTATSSSHIHTPATCRIRPAAIWSATSCRKNSALPPVSFQNRPALRASTDPPTLVSITQRVAAADSGSRSSRVSSSSFHNAVTASGSSAPVRTVTTSRAPRVDANWCTTCADNPSRRCASSTPISTWPRCCCATKVLISRRTLGNGSAIASVSKAANAPNGSGRADSVPTIQLVRSPAAAARANTSRASRVLPTPAAPAMTTPEYLPNPLSARRISLSSPSRPVSGSPLITRGLYPHIRH